MIGGSASQLRLAKLSVFINYSYVSCQTGFQVLYHRCLVNYEAHILLEGSRISDYTYRILIPLRFLRIHIRYLQNISVIWKLFSLISRSNRYVWDTLGHVSATIIKLRLLLEIKENNCIVLDYNWWHKYKNNCTILGLFVRKEENNEFKVVPFFDVSYRFIIRVSYSYSYP